MANSIYSKLSEQKIKFIKQCFFFNSLCACVCSSSQVKFPLFLQRVLDSGLINWVTYPFGRGTGEQHRSNGAWMKKVTKSEFFKGPIRSNNCSLCSSYFRINSIYPRLLFFFCLCLPRPTACRSPFSPMKFHPSRNSVCEEKLLSSGQM